MFSRLSPFFRGSVFTRNNAGSLFARAVLARAGYQPLMVPNTPRMSAYAAMEFHRPRQCRTTTVP